MDDYRLEEHIKTMALNNFVTSNKPPYPRPRRDYRVALKSYKQMKSCRDRENYAPLFNWMSGPRHCSLKPLDQLTPIRLSDMHVNKRHEGKYLKCRVVAEPIMMASMNTLVEDEDGQVEILCVYNLSPSYTVDANDFLPLHTVLIIKEPLVKLMVQDNNYYIRVESPSDVVFVEDVDVEKWRIQTPNTLSYEQLNDLANGLFLKKEYRKAVRHYTQALKVK